VAGWKKKAAEAIKKDQHKAGELVEELNRTGRSKTPVEAQILLLNRVQLNERYSKHKAEGLKAAERGDMETAAAALGRAEAVLVESRLNEKALGTSGSEAGRQLRALREVAGAEDLSELGIEESLRMTDNGRPLNEKWSGRSSTLGKDMVKADAHVARAEEIDINRRLAPAIREIVNKPAPKGRKYGSENTVVTKAAYEAIQKNLRAKFSRMTALIDPGLYAEALKVGVYHIEAGSRNLKRFTKKMVADIGEKVRPHLRKLWMDANKALVGQTRESALKEIKESGKTFDEIPVRHVKALVRGFVVEGVGTGKGGRGRVAEAVHKELVKIYPDIKVVDVKKLITDYGKVTPVTDDEISQEMTRIRGELREELKLRDLLAGRESLNTGQARQKAGSEERELKRQVGDERRKGGFPSALKSVKTRMRNELKDKNKEIQQRKRLKSSEGKTKLEYDAETKALAAELAVVRKTWNELFGGGKRKLTEAQRQKIAETYLKRTNDIIRKRIAEGNLFPEKVKPDQPKSENLTALRAENEKLNAELKALQDVARPPKTREQRVNATRIKNLERSERELLAQEQDPNLAPKAKLPTVEPSPAVLAARASREVVRQRVHKAIAEKRWDELHWARKILAVAWNETSDIPKAVKSSIDQSYAGRQGILQLLAGRYKVVGRAFMAGAKAMGSSAKPGAGLAGRIFDRESPQQVAQELKLKRQPLYNESVRDGKIDYVDTTGTDRSRQSEQYRGKIAKHIPGIGASGRQFDTQGNWSKLGWFQSLAGAFGNKAIPTKAESAIYGSMINIGTGRGQTNNRTLIKIMDGFGPLAWAPRLALSKFQMMYAQPLWTGIATKGGRKGTMRARGVVAFEMVRTLGGYAAVIYLAHKAGAETMFTPDSPTADPTSSKFGKIIVKGEGDEPDKVYDIGGGFFQAAVYASRFISGRYTRSDGEIEDITGKGEGFRGRTRGALTLRYGRSKASPWAGAITTWLVGSDFNYDEPTMEGYIDNLITPLAPGDMYQAFLNMGYPEAAATSMVAWFGIGVALYDQKDRKAKGHSRPKRPSRPTRPSR